MQRQYDATDPENRLVAGELERRWNERLAAVRDLELEIERLDADEAPALTEADREQLMTLGQDLARAWRAGTTPESARRSFARSSRRSSSTPSATRWS